VQSAAIHWKAATDLKIFTLKAQKDHDLVTSALRLQKQRIR
jgi:hypothetical protein